VLFGLYRTAASPMTLSDFKAIHVLQALLNGMFCVQLCSSWQDFNWHSASRGFSAIAELLSVTVMFHYKLTCYMRQLEGIRTDVCRRRDNRSHGAETPVDVVLVFLWEPVKRSAVKVMPRRLHSDLVVVRNVMHLVEHHRHPRLLPLKSRRLRRRVCETTA